MKQIIAILISLISIHAQAEEIKVFQQVLATQEKLISEGKVPSMEIRNVKVQSNGVQETNPVIENFIVTLTGDFRECTYRVSIQGTVVAAGDVKCLTEDEFYDKYQRAHDQNCNKEK